MTLVCSRSYNLAISLCIIIVLSISQTGVSVFRPLLALGAVLVYWQSVELRTLGSRYSVLLNLQFILSVAWIQRFPGYAEITAAIAQDNLMGVMGVLASFSFPFILSQYVINISSPQFLYEKRRGVHGEARVFVGASRLAGLKIAILALVPFFFFGSMVNGVFVSQFASARTFEMQYWGHLIFGDSLLFLCQLLAVFFFFQFTSLLITTASALGMSFLMGTRSGTAALLLFVCVLFLIRLFPHKRRILDASARLKKLYRRKRAFSNVLYVTLLLFLLGGSSLLFRTTAWTDARSLTSILAGSIAHDDSLRERVELVACHSERYLSHPSEVVFGAYFNAGDCSGGYLHSALSVFQVLGLLFSLPTLIFVFMILAKCAKAPGFSLKVFLLLAPSLALCVIARFGFGFFLPSLVLFLRAQEIHIRASRAVRPELYPSIFQH